MPDGPAGDAAPPLRSHWPAALLAVLAGLVAIWAHERLFPAMSWNRDEPVYLWHVEVLRHGQLTATDGGHPELFLPWLSAARDGVMFTQYTLGWPLVLLAARLLTGTAASALPVGAALAVVGTYALAFELTRHRRVAVIAAGLLVASPILPIQGGVYLSYLFTLGIGLIAGALLLSGTRRGRPLRLAVAGVLLGFIFLTRPYDALLWGGAFALGMLLTDPDRRRVVRNVGIAAASAAPLVVVTLLYNRRVTGELLTFPITVADPLDGFGYGTRRLMPGFDTVDYDLGKALRASAKNAVLLPWFLVGGYLGAIAGLAGLWLRRRDPMAKVLVLVAAVFPVGYFVFWGTYLSSLASRISGPIYLVPVYAVVCIFAGVALDHWWDRRRGATVAALVVLALATVPGAVTRFAVNQEISEQQEPWRASVQGLDEPSLVFVVDTGGYLLYANPFSANRPDLGGDLLYAAAGEPSALDLIAAHPDRDPYLQEGSVPAPELGPREDPYELDVDLVPIEVVAGDGVELALALQPPPGAESAEVRVDTGADSMRAPIDLAAGAPVLLGEGGLDVAERGVLTVQIDFARADGSTVSVRRFSPYRQTSDGTIELMTPFVAERYEQLDEDTFQWRHLPSMTELTIQARAAG